MLEMEKAAEFFNKLLNCNIPRVCVENPIPHKYARAIIGNYTQLIQHLVPTNVVGPPPKNMTLAEKKLWHRVHYTSPGKDRWKKRSITYQGFADAFAAQWGIL